MLNSVKIKKDYSQEKYHGQGSQIHDDFHTMSELYFHRMFLFSVVCKSAAEKGFEVFKSKKHAGGDMFPGFFIVGIVTKDGQYNYHYQEKFWDYFTCKEVEFAPEWDGCVTDDLGRLLSLFEQ